MHIRVIEEWKNLNMMKSVGRKELSEALFSQMFCVRGYISRKSRVVRLFLNIFKGQQKKNIYL